MTLPADVHSPDQVSELIMELRSYIDGLRDAALRNRAQASGKPSDAPGVSAMLKKVFENAIDTMTPEEMLHELEELLLRAPVAHLMLAATPAEQLTRQLVVWFRIEIHPQLLLTLSTRRDIGGGGVLRVGSSIYDFSFRRRILDNKKRLTELAHV